MRRRVRFVFALPFLMLGVTHLEGQPIHSGDTNRPAWLAPYGEPSARLIGEALGSTFAWDRLAVLTDAIGHRLSGTPALERAIQWAVAEMNRDGLDNVHTERVMVPKWVRGNESAEIVEPARHAIVMLGLGNSVGTPADGVQAELLVVHSFEELDSQGAAARGRIVFFNVPFTTYGETVRFRAAGPSRAARHGAVASLVRAVGPAGLRTPHTGALQYADDAPKIPAAAVSAEDADRLQRMADRKQKIVVRLKMDAHFAADAESANVIGEIRGRELPEEVVVVSGHLDSWDVGAGATDDGGGCIVTWEALRIMKKLNLRPRRTVRVVLFTNEENGGRGGLAYRDQHRAELGKRDDARIGRRRVPAAGRRLHRKRRSARNGQGDRHAAERDCGRPGHPGRRRRRHRPERPGRAHRRAVTRRGRLEVLHDPSHAGRHDRQDRPGGDGKMRGDRRGDGVCRRRPAAAAATVDSTAQGIIFS
jgi:carboxypeptidase Q